MDKINLNDIGSLGFGTHQMSREAAANAEYAEVSQSRVMTDNAYGFNHRQTPLAIPMNKDQYGFVFITRPQLNMQTDNLLQQRLFVPLTTQTELSYERFVRSTLDPRIQTGYTPSRNGAAEGGSSKGMALECALVDNRNAFIPLLTNSIQSLSGFPDMSLDSFTAPAGVYKEEFTMVDSHSVNYSAYDITATFRNARGAPVMSMFRYWEHYAGHVVEGSLMPYLDMITENEIDYMTRIYRLVLDPSKQMVTEMCCTGASYPTTLARGSVFDFSDEKPYNDANAQIPVTFRSMGFVDNDDIIIRWFNEVVEIFHPGMRNGNRAGQMVKIEYRHLALFNCRGYPRIDPFTRELQWYVDADYHSAKMEAYRAFDRNLDGILGLT